MAWAGGGGSWLTFDGNHIHYCQERLTRLRLWRNITNPPTTEGMYGEASAYPLQPTERNPTMGVNMKEGEGQENLHLR